VGIEGTRRSQAAAADTLTGGEPSDTDAEAIRGVVADDGKTNGDTGGVSEDDAAGIRGDSMEKVAGGGDGGMETMGLSGISMSLSAAKGMQLFNWSETRCPLKNDPVSMRANISCTGEIRHQFSTTTSTKTRITHNYKYVPSQPCTFKITHWGESHSCD
jgi:hypothetical protein